MNNISLLRILQYSKIFADRNVSQYIELTEQTSITGRKNIEFCINATNNQIIKIQSECCHPIAIRKSNIKLCPFCNKIMSEKNEQLVITLDDDTDDLILDFIKDELTELLLLIPELTIEQMVECIKRDLEERNKTRQ